MWNTSHERDSKKKQKLPGEKVSKKQVSQKPSMEKKAKDVAKIDLTASEFPIACNTKFSIFNFFNCLCKNNKKNHITK